MAEEHGEQLDAVGGERVPRASREDLAVSLPVPIENLVPCIAVPVDGMAS